jgi:ubiquinone/menaquinone biosynthesis C-methylase UbiE
MTLRRLAKQWSILGEADPLWAILTVPDKQGGKWETEEFFESGRAEVRQLLDYCASLNIIFAKHRALDFGCGVGRLTQALAEHFDEVVGIDIADSMVKHAASYNRYPVTCRYLVNSTPDLRQIPDQSVDMVYSNKTLQHMEPNIGKGYIREFFRVARRGGPVIFQMASQPKSPLRDRIKKCLPRPLVNLSWRLRTGSAAAMEMYWVAKEEMIEFLHSVGADVVDAVADKESAEGWGSFRYCCRMNSDPP